MKKKKISNQQNVDAQMVELAIKKALSSDLKIIENKDFQEEMYWRMRCHELEQIRKENRQLDKIVYSLFIVMMFLLMGLGIKWLITINQLMRMLGI